MLVMIFMLIGYHCTLDIALIIYSHLSYSDLYDRCQIDDVDDTRLVNFSISEWD